MKFTLILAATCSFLLGCEKDQNCISELHCTTEYLKAKVIQTSDISCYKPMLDFSEDSLKIRFQTNLYNLTYSVINLPTEFNVKEQLLYVSVTHLITEEQFPCNTLGIMLPALKIVTAKKRD